MQAWFYYKIIVLLKAIIPYFYIRYCSNYNNTNFLRIIYYLLNKNILHKTIYFKILLKII